MIVNPSLQHVVSRSPNRPNENEFQFHYTPQGLQIVVSIQVPVKSWPMATTVAAPAARKGFFGIAFKIILWILLLVLIAGTVAFLWFYNGARAALPQLDGTIIVAGLQAPVSVIRDAHGVPHITDRKS